MKKSSFKLFVLYFLLLPMLFITSVEKVYCKSYSQGNSSKYKVYILAGQSNMAGVGMNHELPSEFLGEQENVKIYAEGTIESSLRKVWSTLRPGFGSGSGAFGPELTFGKDMAKMYPDSQILLIKCGWSGTSLQGDWRPPSAGGATGSLYKNLIETVEDALSELDPSIDYEISGMCWMQGESDACNIYPANEYESSLTHFINDVRKDLNVPTMPFIIAMIDDSDVWIEHAIVRQAQINVAQNVPYVGIFDTKDFDTDGTHYKTQGILDMGSCFAEEMVKLSGISSKFVYGDVNGDGVLNSLDYAEIKLILLEITDSLKYTQWEKAADVNGDGIIDSRDAVLIQRRILEVIDNFPIEQ
jgi:hypothetical protein